MKRYFLITLLILATYCIGLKAQTVQWVASEPHPAHIVQTHCVAHDNEGNLVMGGRGYYGGIYLIKYDSNGNKLWEKNYPGNDRSVKKIIIDADGNIYFFVHAPQITLNGIYYHKSPLIKYDKNGDILWAKVIGNGGQMGFYQIETTQNGFYAAGNYRGTHYLENNMVLTGPADTTKYFIGYFNNEAECQWAISDEGGWSIYLICSDTNSFYQLGSINNAQTLGKGAKQVTLYEQDGYNYQAKYNNLGELDWAKQLNTNLSAPDVFGNFYAFERDTNFLVLVKYDDQGIELWRRIHLSTQLHRAQMTADKSGNLFVSGTFTGSLTIGDTTLQGSPDNYNFFLAKLDSLGALKWIITSTGSGSAGSKAISVDEHNNIYITGDMAGEVTFDNITLNEPNGGIFTLKISDDEVTAIEEIKSKVTFNIYPNPTSNTVFISYKSVQTNTSSLTIKNQLGQLFLTKKYPEQNELNETIDMSGYAKGVYFIELISGEAREVKKVVVN